MHMEFNDAISDSTTAFSLICPDAVTIDLSNAKITATALLHTFEGMEYLRTVIMPKDMRSVKVMLGTFKNCPRLRRVEMNSRLPNLAEMISTFENCPELELVRMPSKLPSLQTAAFAFRNCLKLKTAFVWNSPNLMNLTSTFENCPELERFSFHGPYLHLKYVDNCCKGCEMIGINHHVHCHCWFTDNQLEKMCLIPNKLIWRYD